MWQSSFGAWRETIGVSKKSQRCLVSFLAAEFDIIRYLITFFTYKSRYVFSRDNALEIPCDVPMSRIKCRFAFIDSLSVTSSNIVSGKQRELWIRYILFRPVPNRWIYSWITPLARTRRAALTWYTRLYMSFIFLPGYVHFCLAHNFVGGNRRFGFIIRVCFDFLRNRREIIMREYVHCPFFQ